MQQLHLQGKRILLGTMPLQRLEERTILASAQKLKARVFRERVEGDLHAYGLCVGKHGGIQPATDEGIETG